MWVRPLAIEAFSLRPRALPGRGARGEEKVFVNYLLAASLRSCTEPFDSLFTDANHGEKVIAEEDTTRSKIHQR